MAELQLRQSIKLHPGEDDFDIKSCVINEEKLIFADKKNKRLIIHSSDSSFLANIPLSSEPFDIAIVDPQIVVVTYGRDRFIEFINLETKVANKIPLNGNCWGVTYEGGNLYVIVDRQGIIVLTTTGEKTQTIPVSDEFDQATHIAVHGENIVFTTFVPTNLVCTDLEGTVRWQFNKSIINQPRAVTVDSKGNIFVAGFGSHTISLVKENGSNGTVMLNNEDGIKYPCGIYCDRSKHRLLVCNIDNGSSYLYDILYQ